MNPEKQRIAIALFCGWRHEYDTKHLRSVWVSPKSGYAYNAIEDMCPDYPGNRDAIVEVIWDKIVGDEKLEAEFLKQLESIWSNRDDDETICVHKLEMALICSSASYLCEALLRTIGNWIEPRHATQEITQTGGVD